MPDVFVPSPARVLAVIVLYKTHPADSPAFNTLLAARSSLSPANVDLRVLLYDNTPDALAPNQLAEGVRYESAGVNAGLAPAYNRALALAQREACSWLLILDQDTTLPTGFLANMVRVLSHVDADPTIAAIVPRMFDRDRPVAPVFMRFWGTSYAAANCLGISPREVHSTNSATLFRVHSLQRIAGFSPYFWLDYLDGYVFHQLYVHGYKIYIARDIEVVHELSLLHGGNLTPARFQNILRAESAYWDLYGTPIQRLAFNARLFLRVGRQKRRGHNTTITQLTELELRRRLTCSRPSRLKVWKQQMETQIDASTTASQDALLVLPSVSVCMAAFNGERYLHAQLDSILQQLRPTDEIVIVDDASTDHTRDVIASFHDPRIRLLTHQHNQGVLRSFEEAICSASGDILFLSDQDDLWSPDKVLSVLRTFQLHPNTNLVVSDASLIDDDNAPLAPSYYAQLGGFHSAVIPNLAHCYYLGCTMAFRARIRSTILPFPVGHPVLHDYWIGVLNAFTGGETVYIEKPLVAYRRHPQNVTGNRRLKRAQQLRIRWGLVCSLAAFWWRTHIYRPSPRHPH